MKALIGMKNGNGTVLAWHDPEATDTDGIAWFEEIGTDAVWNGLDDAPEGLSVWEGEVVGYTDPETDAELVGTYRPLTPAEWRALEEHGTPFVVEAPAHAGPSDAPPAVHWRVAFGDELEPREVVVKGYGEVEASTALVAIRTLYEKRIVASVLRVEVTNPDGVTVWLDAGDFVKGSNIWPERDIHRAQLDALGRKG